MMDCSPSLISLAVFRTLPRPVSRCLILSASELLKYFEMRIHAAIAASQTIIARVKNPMRSNLHYFVEQIRPQTNAGAQQFFVEFGADTGGSETSQYFSIRIQAAL